MLSDFQLKSMCIKQLQVFFVNRDRVVNRVHLDHKVNAENEVKQDLRALKVTEVSLVFRVFLALL